MGKVSNLVDLKNKEEERLRRRRESQRKRRSKINADPIKKDEYLKKRRLTYKSVAQESLEKQNEEREKWKKRSLTYRQKKKADIKETPPNSLKREAAQRRSKKIRKQRLAEMRKKDEKIKQLEKKCEKYKKRYQRVLSSKIKKSSAASPMSKTRALIKKGKIHNLHVQRKVLFAEVVEAQLKSNYKDLKTNKEKQIFTNMVSGKIIKKYKMHRYCQKYLTERRTKLAEALKASPLEYKKRNLREFKIQNNIQDFFEMDEHSRMCPGKKDVVRKGKVTKQKRFLTDTLKTLYLKFTKMFPDYPVSYSQFCKLRPFWVKPMKVLDRETCKCITHENMKLLINALFKCDILKAKTCNDVINSVCCSKQENCCFRECMICKNNTLSYKTYDSETSGFYWKWMQKKESYFDKKTGENKTCSKMTKHKVETSYGNMVKEFEKSLPTFLKHEATIMHQHETLRNFKESLSVGEVLVHMDWSENWSTKYAQEIQSYHFGGSRKQISLHTVVVYIKNEEAKLQIIGYDGL